MTVKFVLKDSGSNTLKEYILQFSDKISDLKNMIVKDQYESKGSVDIILLLERTRRVFGKFNLEPGVISRSFDNRLLDEFSLRDGEVINIMVKHIDKVIKKEKVVNNFNKNSTGKYVPPHQKNTSNNYNNYKKPIYMNSISNKIDNNPFMLKETDFPPL